MAVGIPAETLSLCVQTLSALTVKQMDHARFRPDLQRLARSSAGHPLAQCLHDLQGPQTARHHLRLKSGRLNRQDFCCHTVRIEVKMLRTNAEREVHGDRMIARAFKPGFRIDLHQKDLNLALQSARSLGLSLPGTSMAQQLFGACVGMGGQDWDHSAMVCAIEALASHQLSPESSGD